jgi:hypothetical protein
MRTVAVSAALVIEIIHREVAKQLEDNPGDLPRGAADSINGGLSRLRDLGHQLMKHGDQGHLA